MGPLSQVDDVLKTGYWITNKPPVLIIPFMVETMPGVVLYIAPSLNQLVLAAFLATLKLLIEELQKLVKQLQSDLREGHVVAFLYLFAAAVALIVTSSIAGGVGGGAAGTAGGPGGTGAGVAGGAAIGAGVGLALAVALIIFVFSGDKSQSETNPPITIYLGNMVLKDIPVKTFERILMDTQRILKDIFSKEPLSV